MQLNIMAATTHNKTKLSTLTFEYLQDNDQNWVRIEQKLKLKYDLLT